MTVTAAPATVARRDVGFWLVAAIVASTLVAGVVQVVAPGVVLDILDAERTDTTRHFFAIVGMFMAVISGALGHSLLRSPRNEQRVVLLWGAVQKAGAFVAVSLGVINDVFSGLAVLIALNDLASAGILLWYRKARATAP